LDTLRRRLELELSPVLPRRIEVPDVEMPRKLAELSDRAKRNVEAVGVGASVEGPRASASASAASRSIPSPRWARVLAHIVRTEGVQSLYRGFWVNVLKLAPAATAQFVLYDVLRSALTDTIQVPS